MSIKLTIMATGTLCASLFQVSSRYISIIIHSDYLKILKLRKEYLALVKLTFDNNQLPPPYPPPPRVENKIRK